MKRCQISSDIDCLILRKRIKLTQNQKKNNKAESIRPKSNAEPSPTLLPKLWNGLSEGEFVAAYIKEMRKIRKANAITKINITRSRKSKGSVPQESFFALRLLIHLSRLRALIR